MPKTTPTAAQLEDEILGGSSLSPKKLQKEVLKHHLLKKKKTPTTPKAHPKTLQVKELQVFQEPQTPITPPVKPTQVSEDPPRETFFEEPLTFKEPRPKTYQTLDHERTCWACRKRTNKGKVSMYTDQHKKMAILWTCNEEECIWAFYGKKGYERIHVCIQCGNPDPDAAQNIPCLNCRRLTNSFYYEKEVSLPGGRKGKAIYAEPRPKRPPTIML